MGHRRPPGIGNREHPLTFLTLGLPEAAYLYMGLALQQLVRASSLHLVPYAIVLPWLFVLLLRQVRHGIWGVMDVFGYFAACVLICILFWPEAVRFVTMGDRLDPTQVASYAAQQEPGAEVVTAADTQQVPETLLTPAFVPVGYSTILKMIVEIPLALAQAINTRVHRTFSSLLPVTWLFDQALTADVTGSVRDWVQNCYVPVLTETLTAQEATSADELAPWDGTPLAQRLEARVVTPGAQTGLNWMTTPGDTGQVGCGTYLLAIESRVQARLGDTLSPGGTPLLDVFNRELGWSSIQQGRFMIYRAIRQTLGDTVPAPSLAGTYLALRGLAVGGGALEGAASGGITGWLLKSAGPLGTLAGFLTGGAQAIGAEFQSILSGLSWLLRLALLFTWYAPTALGMAGMTMDKFFPFVVLWALWPGQQLLPLALFFTARLFLACAPLWYALIDLAARLAAGQPPQVGPEFAQAVTGLFTAQLWVASVTALGFLVLPAVTGLVLFKAFTGIARAVRGGVV